MLSFVNLLFFNFLAMKYITKPGKMLSCIDIIVTTFMCLSFSFKAYILVCFFKAKIYKEVNNIIQQIERKIEYIQKLFILSCVNQLMI